MKYITSFHYTMERPITIKRKLLANVPVASIASDIHRQKIKQGPTSRYRIALHIHTTNIKQPQ